MIRAIIRGLCVALIIIATLGGALEAEAFFRTGSHIVFDEAMVAASTIISGYAFLAFFISVLMHPSSQPLLNYLKKPADFLGYHITRACVGVFVGIQAFIVVAISSFVVCFVVESRWPNSLLSRSSNELATSLCGAVFCGSIAGAILTVQLGHDRYVARSAAIASIAALIASIWLDSIVILVLVTLDEGGMFRCTMDHFKAIMIASGIAAGIGGAVLLRIRKL